MAAHVTRGQLWGAAGSVAAHVLFLVLALWSLRTRRRPPEPEAVQVDLIRQRAPSVRPSVRPRPGRDDRSPAAAPGAPSRPDARPGPAPDQLSAGASPAETAEAAAARKALRAALGCQHAAFLGLSPEERRNCDEALALNRTDPFRLNLDLHGRYTVNPEPYLVRMPRNGCKVRATGDDGPMGQSGVAAGVSCAKPF